jgi:hypothetical protein|tara:strand:- start:3247 stop:3453 length:207 start_codon:yes stop_codon:yes gene_type:complete
MSESYPYQAYPKMVYAKCDGEVINTVVQTPAELKALGLGWAESPDGPFSVKAPQPSKRVGSKTKTRRV